MTTTLITGATRGLGLETATRLAAAGHTVYVGARDLDRGRDVAGAIGARAVRIDVTSDDSVAAAAAELADREGALDVLVNNAGTAGPRTPVEQLTAADVEAVYATNVLGPVRTTAAFLPLLRGAQGPLVVNVSSGVASLRVMTDPARPESKVVLPAYTSSKAALTMLTLQYARALPWLHLVAVDPGPTATELTGHRGLQSVEEGARVIVDAASGALDVPSGSFVDASGPVPG